MITDISSQPSCLRGSVQSASGAWEEKGTSRRVRRGISTSTHALSFCPRTSKKGEVTKNEERVDEADRSVGLTGSMMPVAQPAASTATPMRIHVRKRKRG